MDSLNSTENSPESSRVDVDTWEEHTACTREFLRLLRIDNPHVHISAWNSPDALWHEKLTCHMHDLPCHAWAIPRRPPKSPITNMWNGLYFNPIT